MSLPRILGCTLDTLPDRVPYLTLPDDTTLVLPPAPDGMLTVGMVWSANPINKTGRKRTCPLEHWEAIARLDSVQLYSLQKEPSDEERDWLKQHGIIDLSAQLTDLAETAAAIQQLDLVITVDTVVAHLSGALGKPTWILLMFMPDWRWLTERTDSPWYPTARLFRQPAPSAWDAVLSDVQAALTDDPPRTAHQPITLPPDAIALSPDLQDQLTATYDAYQAGDLITATAQAEQIRQNYPETAGVLHLCAVLESVTGRTEAAIADYYTTLRLHPVYAESHGNLAVLLKQQGNEPAAMHHYRRAIAINPQYLSAYCNLGNILQSQGELEDAIALYRTALDVDPTYTKVWMNMANALAKQQNRSEAIAAYQQAITYDPNYVEAYSNLGNLYAEYGDTKQGLAMHEKAVAINPNEGQAQHNYSIALLRNGNYPLGFERYEYRWQLPEFWAKNGQTFEQPRWDGSPLNGRTLLVWSEQGFGDVMQFVRFLPLIQGGTVILDAHPALVRVLNNLEQTNRSDRIQVIPTGTGIPAFDVQIPIMSLPHALGSTLDTIPATVPYLAVPSTARVTLPGTAAAKIGLVWAAKATHPTFKTRSIPLADLQPLLNLPDVAFYSLQKDCPERDRPVLEQHPNLHDLSNQLNDFGDTAAAIAQLDLVITIDTSVAHLAGALNHPTWLLLPVASDWRWLRDRTDTPWYPSLRLFRQSEIDQWEPVLHRVYSELRSQFQRSQSPPPFTVVTDSSAMSKRKSRSSSKSRSAKSGQSKPSQPIATPAPNESVPKLSELLADAVAKHRAGETDAAEALYNTIRQHYPQDGNSVHLLGVIAYQRNQHQEAVELYEQALQRLPNYAEIHNNMAVALDKLDRKDDAFNHYQKALALKPDYAEAWHNLGTLEQSRLNIDTAIHHYQKSVALKPDYADGFNSWGSAYKRINQLPEALEKYNRAIDIDPNHVEARCGRAAVLMKMGDYRRGFMEYEWRWKHADCPPRLSRQPAWDGSDFHGKVLLLYAEQGLGDSIQMIRYIPNVLERGDRIWVECNQPGLARLFRQIDGIEQVFERGEAPKTYSLHAPLMSMPRFFGTTVDTVPTEIPYLSIPDEIRIPLPPQTPDKINVGIVWSANPLSKTGKTRSCELELFEPLLSHPGLNVYSIQKDVSPDDQVILDRHGVLCLGSKFSDLADTACIIQQLDLVITVDTVIAHLTGALGKPAWVMLNMSCDWRWLGDRTDSPWYPTLRLFRQKVLAEWESVIADMVGAIADFVPQAQPTPKPSAPAVPVPVVRQPLGIGWPMSLMTGWGNFGVNLVLQLSQMADFGPVLLVKSEAMDKLNPLHRSLIEPLMGEFQRLQQIMAANPGKQLKLNVPILHALGNGLQCGLLQSLSGSRNVGVIFLEDTSLPPDAIARGRQFDMIAAGSKWNEDILRAAGLTNTYSLPQGIDPTRFHPGPKSGLLGDRFVVFSGGKLEYRKGQDIVVAAFQRFVQTHPDALLITAWHNFWPQFMAGIEQTGNVNGLPALDKQRRLQVKNWLVANGIPAQNTMDIGPIPNYLMGEVIREADVAVFPNRGEGGTNLAAMECLACGIPTIISANTGHLDIVGDHHCYPLRSQAPAKPRGPFVGVEGWGESDVDEVVAALEQVYQDRTEAKQKGAAAAEFMQDWTWAKQVRRICDGLRRVGIV
jgi:tetratricopeptide (TPR) repeat protein/glycosyltransferase involved in cell wall biosynthesis